MVDEPPGPERPRLLPGPLPAQAVQLGGRAQGPLLQRRRRAVAPPALPNPQPRQRPGSQLQQAGQVGSASSSESVAAAIHERYLQPTKWGTSQAAAAPAAGPSNSSQPASCVPIPTIPTYLGGEQLLLVLVIHLPVEQPPQGGRQRRPGRPGLAAASRSLAHRAHPAAKAARQRGVRRREEARQRLEGRPLHRLHHRVLQRLGRAREGWGERLLASLCLCRCSGRGAVRLRRRCLRCLRCHRGGRLPNLGVFVLHQGHDYLPRGSQCVRGRVRGGVGGGGDQAQHACARARLPSG